VPCIHRNFGEVKRGLGRKGVIGIVEDSFCLHLRYGWQELCCQRAMMEVFYADVLAEIMVPVAIFRQQSAVVDMERVGLMAKCEGESEWRVEVARKKRNILKF
jgi:hypothetical protein